MQALKLFFSKPVRCPITAEKWANPEATDCTAIEKYLYFKLRHHLVFVNLIYEFVQQWR